MLKRAPVRWASVEPALIVGGPCPCARAALCRSGSARDEVAAAQQSCDFVGADCTLRRAGMAFRVQEPPRNSARGGSKSWQTGVSCPSLVLSATSHPGLRFKLTESRSWLKCTKVTERQFSAMEGICMLR